MKLYKGVDGINIAIMTCANYNYTDANAVEREQERTLHVKDLAKVNYDPDKSDRNIILEHDNMKDEYKTFKSYVKAYKEKEDIGGRFNVDTTSDRNATKVLSCFVMSASHDLISSMTREEQVEYFRSGLEFLKEEYPEKDLQRYNPERNHTKKLSIKEYKENQDMKRELEQERQCLLSKNERLKEIEAQLDKAYDIAEKAYQYNQEVERYCNEQGITFYQYEKQCFWADRDYGNYPEPEYNNPDRNWERDKNIEPERYREERER